MLIVCCCFHVAYLNCIFYVLLIVEPLNWYSCVCTIAVNCRFNKNVFFLKLCDDRRNHVNVVHKYNTSYHFRRGKGLFYIQRILWCFLRTHFSKRFLTLSRPVYALDIELWVRTIDNVCASLLLTDERSVAFWIKKKYFNFLF